MTNKLQDPYPANRVIPLEGASNFRDMGGYLTEDGRTVKYGQLFRSDEMGSLTEQDKQLLQTLNIKTILDYRSSHEADRSPTPTAEGIVYRRIEANPVAAGSSGSVEDYLKSGQLNRNTMIEMYAKLPFANPAYQFLMETIQSSEQMGILHHCAGGKDRTGVGAALILKLLGVSDADIMEDYLLTNETLGPKTSVLVQSMADKLDAVTLQNLKDVFEASEHYLSAALEAVLAEYGDWDVYFEREFDITTEKRNQIRDMYLE